MEDLDNKENLDNIEHNSKPTPIKIKKSTSYTVSAVGVLLVIGYIISLFTPIINLGLLICTFGGLGYVAFRIWKDLNDNINNIGKQNNDNDA